MNDLPITLTPDEYRRLGRMLRAFESGLLGRQTQGGRGAARPDEKLQIVLTGPADGGGKYEANLLLPPTADVTATGDLALADIGVADTETPVLALNTQEVGQSTHALTEGGAGMVCSATRHRLQDDGTLVVIISEIALEPCAESGT